VGHITITSVSPLLSWIADDDPEWVSSHEAPTMDSLGLWSGLALYRSELPAGAGAIAIDEIRDHASVFVDGLPVGEFDRAARSLAIPVPPQGGRLDLLVENRGRVNYGPRIGEAKGIIGELRASTGQLTGWKVLPLSPETIEGRAAEAREASAEPGALIAGPAMAWGEFEAAAPVDHFVSTAGWGSGWLWLNGTLVGRHSSDSPATTLYLPASLVRQGANEIMILELRASSTAALELVSGPELGPIQ
jgi:beta-galactosidase